MNIERGYLEHIFEELCRIRDGLIDNSDHLKSTYLLGSLMYSIEATLESLEALEDDDKGLF